MKKQVIFIFCVLVYKFYFAQTTKVYNGPFKNIFTNENDGNAIYTYYEDENTREYIKHGEFKYTFNGTTDKLKGFTQVITGNFNKGLRNGQWVYNYTMKDVGPDNNGYYTTLNLSLISNYKDGYANGTWKEKGVYKKRNTYYSNGQNLWNEYTKDVNVEIIMNFLNGKSFGDFYINDDEARFKAKGKFDNLNLGTDIWEINDFNTGENVKITFKDNFIIDVISRNSSGVVNPSSINNQKLYDEFIIAKNMSLQEREEQGLFIDTIPSNDDVSVISKLLTKYIDKLFEDMFMYNEIEGDLSYNEKNKILGGEVRLTKVKYDLLTDNKYYTEGQKNIENKQYLKAYENLDKIDIFLKPSEKKILQMKREFVALKVDSTLKSLENNKIYIDNLINKSKDTLESIYSHCINTIFDENKNKIKELNDVLIKEDDDENKIKEKQEKLILYKNHNELMQKILERKTKIHQKNINDLKKNINESLFIFSYKKESIKIYDVKNELVLENLKKHENDLMNEIIFINNNANIQNKIIEIEKLNDEHNKKTIYKKFQIVLNYYKDEVINIKRYIDNSNLYNDDEEFKKIIENVSQINLFLNNIIYLYSDKFKVIEKELKDIENPEYIKNYVIKIKQ